MYYFLKNKDFNLGEYDFDIVCTPRFTKKDQSVFDFFVNNFDIDKDFSEFPKDKLKLKESELEKELHDLSKKTIFCRIFKENVEISKFYFNIFDIIVVESDKVIYKFSNEIRLTKKRGNFYSRINVLAFLQFKYTYTKEIFKVILRENKRKSYIEYDIKDFKKLLHIDEDTYSRYYDLENKVLNPTIKDIEYGEISLWFEKVKRNDNKTSRVTSVRIHYSNLYHIAVHRDTNEILKEFASYIEDFTEAYDIVCDYRKIRNFQETYDYVKNNLPDIFKSKK